MTVCHTIVISILSILSTHVLCPGEGWAVDAVAAQPGQVLLGGGGAQHQDVPHHPDQEEAGGLQGGVRLV